VGRSCQENEKTPLRSVAIPFVKSISEKFKCIGNCCSVRMIFKTKCTLRCSTSLNQTKKWSPKDSMFNL